MTQIPEQIRQLPLTKVCHPDECRSHPNCSYQGKRPVTSVEDTHSVIEIKRWLEHGGNYGVVATEDNALVIIDADCQRAIELVEQVVPATFSVQSSPGSAHFYLKVPGYQRNRNWKAGTDEFASVRSSNWHAVGPNSVHPETGAEYRVRTDTDISVIQESLFAELESAFSESVNSREDGAAGGGGGGGAAGSSRTASDLEIQPSRETLSVLGFINSDTLRQKIGKVIDHPDPPRNVRVWAGGWLHSAAGLTERQLRTLLEQQADWATDSGRIRTEVRSLVRESVDNCRADESVNLDYYLSPGDMEAEASESRKTESGGRDARHHGGENMSETEYSTTEEVTVTESDDQHEGDYCVRATVTRATEAEDSYEFSQILAGQIEEDSTFGASPNWQTNQDGQDKTRTVGSADPDYLRTVAKALEQLADDLE